MSVKPTNIPKCHLRQSADSAGNISRHCKLGELTENIRTFALPFENQTYTFNMYFEYDSWNRIKSMTYPDGEVVSYGYNRGGMLESVLGNKNGVSSDYIKEIRYNKYELKDSVSYGNGTGVRYMYDSLLRLSHLRSACADGVMQDIDYDYDSVSNITNIANSAPMMPNGLGGTYSQSFSYDNMYRLMGSSGIWAGSDSLDYHTETEYHANGRIKRKQVTAKVLSNGNVSQISYNNGYYYDNLQQPNTLSRITATEEMVPGISIRNGNDRSSSFLVRFSWDATGNMVSQDPAGDAGRRFLCWDEQNRLQGVVDGKHLSYYLYDANGDRTFKLTGKGDLQNISGTWQYYYLLENATLYASPYLVATDKGYTKHYYAESERIASKIGGGGLTELGIPLYNDDAFIKKMKANSTMMDKVLVGCLNAKYYEVKPVLQHLYDWQDSVQPEDNCYWYHPDHLGSSSWITYTDGSAVQHLHYLPWGEDFVDQRNTTWNAMYTFSAKERDSETGLSYFGSRYYSSDLSVWLSVDPMSDKYPYQSGYVYCGNNPIKIIDPNGDDEWEVNETGYIRHIHNDKPNRLYAVSGTQKGEWGERKSEVTPLDVDESIMNSIQTIGKNTSFSAKDNRENMNSLFDFLADNTNVEWTQVSSHLDGIQYDFLTTSHDNITTELPFGLNVHLNHAASKGLLDVFKHSHPNKYTGDNYYLAGIYPLSCNIRSEGDLKTKDKLIQNLIRNNGFVRNLPLFILRNGGKNYEY